MSSIVNFIRNNVALCVASCGFALIGFLGYRLVKWLIQKCHKTAQIDRVAREAMRRRPEHSVQPNPLLHRVTKDDKLEIVEKDGTHRKPEILLFNCNYGSGHKMATKGIEKSLEECSIDAVDIYDGPLKPLDPLRTLAPRFNNEKIFNLMAKHELNGLMNGIVKLAPATLHLQKGRIEKLLLDHIAQKRYDMIISCIPAVNPMLESVAKKLNIPFLVVTTDIDISNFCMGFSHRNPPRDTKNFRITVPFSQESWEEDLGRQLPEAVKESLQYSFGYPTRREFSETPSEATLNELREEYQIKEDEQVILVMMGGNAAQAAISYADLLLQMNDQELDKVVGKDTDRNKIRLICLCGDTSKKENKQFMDELNARNKGNQRVTIHACKGTPRIAEIASLPELATVISKPGGGTVNEMIKKRVPMVYHISSTLLDWEKGNLQYGEKHHLGKAFQVKGRNKKALRKGLVNALSETFALHHEIQDGSRDVPEAAFDFSDNCRSAVQEMLAGVAEH